MPEPIVTNGGTRYEPWTDGYAVGFQATLPSGEVQFIYLNPSNEDLGDTPTVMVYRGEAGDPHKDVPEDYHDLEAIS